MFDEVIKWKCWDSCSEAFVIVETDETILPLSETAINFNKEKQEENGTENC